MHRWMRVIALLVLTAGPSLAQAWWDTAWAARKPITIAPISSASGNDDATHEVPVLLRLHEGNFPQFLLAAEGGADLRAIDDDDQTVLPTEVEKFDPATQIGLAWIRVPVRADGKPRRVHLYFGNSLARVSEDSTGRLAAFTDTALHFADARRLLANSGAARVRVEGNAVADPAGLIGGGALLRVGRTLHVVDDDPATSAAQGWNLSLWLKADDVAALDGSLIEYGRGSGRVIVATHSGNLLVSSGDAHVNAAKPLDSGAWVHLGLSASAGELRWYVNGAEAGRLPIGNGLIAGDITVGGAGDLHVDELVAGPVGRSAAYFAFLSSEQGPGHDRIVSYGADQNVGQADAAGPATSATPDPYAVIVQAVFSRKEARAEQVVIVLCLGFAAVALLVAVNKWTLLSRSRRATRAFLGAFASASREDAALGLLTQTSGRYSGSPLYALYTRASAELEARITGNRGAALSAPALRAIERALGSTLVAEQDRLSGQLVVLTLAIAGGPFLGLLGTVIGVMTTFAGIAAAGDVNVAAIAPGMAAALLATVAGLGIAIPALFAYNVFTVRIRRLSNEMRAFAGELMARIDEHHGAEGRRS